MRQANLIAPGTAPTSATVWHQEGSTCPPWPLAYAVIPRRYHPFAGAQNNAGPGSPGHADSAGRMTPYQDDGKRRALIAHKVEGAGEHSGSYMDMRWVDSLTSADSDVMISR